MARVKKGVNAHKRHKKVLKQAKGFYGSKSKIFRCANPAVMRALDQRILVEKIRRETTENCGLLESMQAQE